MLPGLGPPGIGEDVKHICSFNASVSSATAGTNVTGVGFRRVRGLGVFEEVSVCAEFRSHTMKLNDDYWAFNVYRLKAFIYVCSD